MGHKWEIWSERINCQLQKGNHTCEVEIWNLGGALEVHMLGKEGKVQLQLWDDGAIAVSVVDGKVPYAPIVLR